MPRHCAVTLALAFAAACGGSQGTNPDAGPRCAGADARQAQVLLGEGSGIGKFVLVSDGSTGGGAERSAA